jgi:hypothetical protein
VKPPVGDRVPARSGGGREEWRESLHPSVDRDLVDLDPTLTEELLDVAGP